MLQQASYLCKAKAFKVKPATPKNFPWKVPQRSFVSAIDLIKYDHKMVDDLFVKFKESKDLDNKKAVGQMSIQTVIQSPY
jgi:hypothetical protein